LFAAHDGFTLRDLVSYNDEHNEANGEDNQDGESHNVSWNCGAEGPTNHPAVLALRARQVRNLLTTILVSQGVQMLVGGDEIGRTQGGNNNGYCQDNDIAWVDWEALAFRMPLDLGGHWQVVLNTARALPERGPAVESGESVPVEARSMLVLQRTA
jgi:pullulanase/glycogen debranching enzyme